MLDQVGRDHRAGRDDVSLDLDGIFPAAKELDRPAVEPVVGELVEADEQTLDLIQLVADENPGLAIDEEVGPGYFESDLVNEDAGRVAIPVKAFQVKDAEIPLRRRASA